MPKRIFFKSDPLTTVHTLSNGTEVTLTVKKSAQEFFTENSGAVIPSPDSVFLNVKNVLQKLEVGMRFVEAQGLKAAPKLDVTLTNLPGNGSRFRSHIYPALGKIVFDVSEMIRMNTVVHEITHAATPRLCATASDFLSEGLATYIERKYEGNEWDYGRAAELRGSISGKKFHRSPGRKSRPEEALCYEYGKQVWTLLEMVYGEDEVIALVQRIETADPPVSVRKAFEDFTGQSPKSWIRNLYDLEEERAQPTLSRLLQDPDEKVRWKAALAYVGLLPFFSQENHATELADALLVFFSHADVETQLRAMAAYLKLATSLSQGELRKRQEAFLMVFQHADRKVAMRAVFAYKDYFVFLRPEERRQGLVALRGLIGDGDAGLHHAMVVFYVRLVPSFSDEEIAQEAEALRGLFHDENANVRGKAINCYGCLASRFSEEEIQRGLEALEGPQQDPENFVRTEAAYARKALLKSPSVIR